MAELHKTVNIRKRTYYAAVPRLSVNVLSINITILLRFYTLIFAVLLAQTLPCARKTAPQKFRSGLSVLVSQASITATSEYRVVRYRIKPTVYNVERQKFACTRFFANASGLVFQPCRLSLESHHAKKIA